MPANLPPVPTIVTPGDLGDELGSFLRHLRAGNVSPNTVHAYGGTVVSLGTFLIEHSYPAETFRPPMAKVKPPWGARGDAGRDGVALPCPNPSP